MTDAELEQCICSIIVKGMTGPVLPFTSAQAVLAAVRASGRLAPDLSDDVVKAAGDAGIKALEAYNAEHYMPNWKDSTRAAVAGAAPIIAAAAEAKAREEWARYLETAPFPVKRLMPTELKARDTALAAAIRTGSAS